MWQTQKKNCDKTQKLKLWQNSKTQIVTILKKKLWQNSKTQIVTKLELWQILIYEKSLKRSFIKNIWTPWQPMRCSYGSVLRFFRCLNTHQQIKSKQVLKVISRTLAYFLRGFSVNTRDASGTLHEQHYDKNSINKKVLKHQ